MAHQNNSGVVELVAALDERMRAFAESPLVLDFGEIRADGSLRTNTFPIPIPKTGYRVCRSLTLGEAGIDFCEVKTTTETGKAYLPENIRKLKAGDRVLVAWVQAIPVVIDIILKP